MYSKLENYKRKSKHLIAIDSDGCVFDTMTLKHQRFFYPLLEEEFHLESWNKDLSKKWDNINLYEVTRGVNRFLGVYLLFENIEEDFLPLTGTMMLYNEYVEKNDKINLEGLEKLYEETLDDFVGGIINWSKRVNHEIDLNMPIVAPFEESKQTIKELSEKADIAIVSSANEKALLKEWSEAGLLDYVSVLTSQNEGSKQDILKELILKGYDKENVLMIGDSNGDRMAAVNNQVSFRLIEAGQENLSWIQIRNEIESGGLLNDL